MTDEWDVFISYARPDAEWVNEVLCRELLSRFINGRSPKLFVDTGPDGLAGGSIWMRALADAVQRSTFFIPVYSADYLARPICRREMDWAMDWHSDDDRIVPLRIDPAVEVPFVYSPISYLSTTRPDWLEKLCRRLGLAGLRDRPQLRFHTSIADVQIDHTLPEQRVGLVGHVPGLDEETVTLDTAPTPGLLRGTRTVTTANGVAVFRDLSIAEPTAHTRLVARYPGSDAGESTTFAVRGARPPRRRRGQATAAWFRADSRTVVTLDERGFGDVIKQYVRWGDRIAVAGWAGLVAVVGGDGSEVYRLGDGLAVPGALCPVGDRLYAGMWSGQVWAIDGSGPQPLFHHPAGVQSMAAVDGQLLVVGFDGALVWYDSDGHPAAGTTHRLEPVVWGLLVRPDCVIAAGAERVHRLDLADDTVISLRLLEDGACGVVTGVELAAVYNREGHGIRFDSQLEVRGAFRSPAQARPVDMDDAGTTLLTADPDGTCAILVDDRVVYANQEGATAIAPDGSRVALLGPDGIRTCLVDDLPQQ